MVIPFGRKGSCHRRAVAGVPTPRPGHAEVMAELALAMQAHDHGADVLSRTSRARRRLMCDSHEVLIPSGTHSPDSNSA